MKKKYRVSLGFLLIVIVAILLSIETYTPTGVHISCRYDDNTHVLTLSGNGPMPDYSLHERPWDSYSDQINTVVIENGITTIANSSFYELSKLTSISIPSTVISIGHHAFYMCGDLKSITLPANLTAIGTQAFEGCFRLREVITHNPIPQIIHKETFHSGNPQRLVIPPGSLFHYAGADIWKDIPEIVELQE